METDWLISKNAEHINAARGGLFGPYPMVVCSEFQQPGYIAQIQMNKGPQRVICPCCRVERVTVVTRRSGKINDNLAIMTAIAMLVFTVLTGLAGVPFLLLFGMIPLVVWKFYDKVHCCPACKQIIGRRRFGY